ncbi:MAG: HNH endonuclease [Candidatus Sumerlaeota bacterium]|nr:HNH endonuclease [Candidatus Sumerlaeota bacterium]
MSNVCIYCLQEKEMTLEHIIPKSIGGALTIDAVCKECNSKIGTEIEGKFIDSVLMKLPRFVEKIPGKSGKIPNPFDEVGETQDGTRINLDDDLKPYIFPEIKKEKISDEAVRLEIKLDKQNSIQLPDILEKEVERISRKEGWNLSKIEIQNRAKQIVEDIKTKCPIHSFQPTIHYQFTIDHRIMCLEYAKIAYEMAFYLWGYDYIYKSDTAKKIRNAIINLEETPPIHGQIPFKDNLINRLFGNKDKHYILIIGGGCYINLFGISGIIQFEETSSQFMLIEENYQIFEFDFHNRTFTQEKYIERLTEIVHGQPQ